MRHPELLEGPHCHAERAPDARSASVLSLPKGRPSPSRPISARLKRGIVFSIALHLIALALFFALYHPAKPPVPQVVVFGHISIVQRPKAPPPPPPAAQKVSPSVVQSHAAAARYAPPPPRPRVEIAHITPRALTYQPKDTHSHANVQTVLPQVDYSKTIAKLRQENNPVLAAQQPVNVGAHTHNYSTDFSSSIGTVGAGNGYLEPVKSWHDGGYDYYYLHYEVEYPDGSTETGIVPWPVRYLPQADPFRLGIHHMPLPGPLPDFVPAADTVFHPLTKYCYEHRDEISDCPIAHD